MRYNIFTSYPKSEQGHDELVDTIIAENADEAIQIFRQANDVSGLSVGAMAVPVHLATTYKAEELLIALIMQRSGCDIDVAEKIWLDLGFETDYAMSKLLAAEGSKDNDN